MTACVKVCYHLLFFFSPWPVAIAPHPSSLLAKHLNDNLSKADFIELSIEVCRRDGV